MSLAPAGPAHLRMARRRRSRSGRPQAIVGSVAVIVDEDSAHFHDHQTRSEGRSGMLTEVSLGSGARTALFPERVPGTDR